MRARLLDNRCEYTRIYIDVKKRSTGMNWTEKKMGGGDPGRENEEKLGWEGVAGSCPGN